MPASSNPRSPQTNPRNMPRLRPAGNTIKILASIFVIAFLCAYAHTWLRYGIRHTATVASVTRPAPQAFPPLSHAGTRSLHRRQAFFRPVHQASRRARRTKPFYLASLRRIRRLFSQLLVVRS